MKYKLFKMDLSIEIEKIKKRTSSTIEFYTQVIFLCKKQLSSWQLEVVNNGFNSQEAEIHFFKVIKQEALYNLVYHSELKFFELHFPRGNKISQRKNINKKINLINDFFNSNKEFVQYIKQGFDHLDKFYFTRQFADDFQTTYANTDYRDPDFSTSHDLLLARLKAYEKFIGHLERKLQQLENPTFEVIPKSKLKWTSSKAALTELTYALYHGGAVNNGNSDIIEIAQALHNTFNFPMGDVYRTYVEIRSRKKGRTKFLDELSTSLLSGMNSMEE